MSQTASRDITDLLECMEERNVPWGYEDVWDKSLEVGAGEGDREWMDTLVSSLASVGGDPGRGGEFGAPAFRDENVGGVLKRTVWIRLGEDGPIAEIGVETGGVWEEVNGGFPGEIDEKGRFFFFEVLRFEVF